MVTAVYAGRLATTTTQTAGQGGGLNPGGLHHFVFAGSPLHMEKKGKFAKIQRKHHRKFYLLKLKISPRL